MVRALEPVEEDDDLLEPHAVIKSRASAKVNRTKIGLINFIKISFIDMSQIG